MSHANITDASHHITNFHPVRDVDLDERPDYDLVRLVEFQRGYEALVVAVYCDRGTGTDGDAEEAAVEYLSKNFPESITDEEKESESADRVRAIKNPYKIEQGTKI